jgi:hypothetical protein
MIEEITAGIDWISISLGKSEWGYELWRGEVLYALHQVAKEGNQTEHRKMLGYEGLASGNCFVGFNETTGYAQFSGDKANYAFDYAMHPRAHVSRLDVQVTIRTDVMNVREGKRCYRAAMDSNKNLREGRKRKIWLIVGSDGGDTCYIGAASSDQRARIYNKEVQSEDISYTRCWRYEVVLRNELSTELAASVPNQDAERAQFCVSFVADWLSKRGISIPNLVSKRATALPIKRTRPTDVERKLNWLRYQVRPTIRVLRELGYFGSAKIALGLDVEEEPPEWQKG